jgi:plastocyanin domain-containing protein
VTTPQIIVTLLGGALIGWVVWYFFLAVRAEGHAATSGGVQQIRIDVRGGYTPAVVRVEAGRPVRLDFFRDETNPCTEEVVLPDFGIRTWLPAHETTPVEFTPEAPGTYEFACGMGMVHGKLVVEPAAT